MTETARFDTKDTFRGCFSTVIISTRLPYYLLKYKYMIKAVAAYAVTLHLPGEKKATLMRLLELLYD